MPVDGNMLRQCGPEGERLLDELVSLEARCNQLLDGYKRERIVQLEGEHRELVLVRRKLVRDLDGLRDQEVTLNTHARSIDKQLRDANFEMKILKEQPPNAAYALSSEIEEYNRQLAEAQKRCDAALS